MRRSLLACLVPLSALTACLDQPGAYVDHDELSDFDPVPAEPPDGKADVAGIPATFDRDLVMTDALFGDALAIDGDGVQAFFEHTPYGTRSWLADATVGEARAADAITDAARAAGIHPLVMVARMQVEQSLVSKTVAPSPARIDYAFGCGCPDGRACDPAYRGLDKQVACAAATLARWYQGSIDGTGPWQAGRARRTLDPLTVTPRSHATASLYAYTPWVLTGRGGNWLVWNVTRRYLRHADGQGTLHPAPPEPAPDGEPPGSP